MKSILSLMLKYAWGILLGYIGFATTGLSILHWSLYGGFDIISLMGFLPLPALVVTGYLYEKNRRLREKLNKKIEELYKSQEGLHGKKAEIERVNKELEAYTYVISHDLKEPLRSLRIFTDFLMKDYSNQIDEKGKDYLERLQKASIRLSDLVDDLLELSRIGRKKVELKEVDLNELLAEVKDELAAIIEDKNAEVRIDSLPVVKCHKSLMGELFRNLISNSIKFNEEEKPIVEVKYYTHNGEYRLSVKDNGIGIEEKYLNKIFGIFKQLNPPEKYDGTGAGLTICKKIVEEHGGKIWAESKVGEGSTFHITIPNKVSMIHNHYK